jgi:hypothetical protein
MTGAKAFHSSARHQLNSAMMFINQEMNERLEQVSLDGKEVLAIRKNLDHYSSNK